VIAVRLYTNVKSEIIGAKKWMTLAQGLELREMTFSHINGKQRIYIIIKKKE